MLGLGDDWLIVVGLMLLQVASVTLLVYAIFSNPVKPEIPANRRIAMAMGLFNRQTVFEQASLQPVMALLLSIAARFPFMRKKIRQDLEASGNPQNYSVDEYLALAFGSCFLLTGVVGVIMIIFFGTGALSFFLTFMAMILGFYMPLITLSSLAKARVMRIAKRLPYTLDLIALLMQAGATFSEAVKTLIHDNPEDDLNQELSLVLSEIDFGSNRAEALRNMAQRIPLDTLRSVIGAVNQAERMGTPLSTILKNQSNSLRNTRSVRAEELSAKASTKILVPSVLIMIAVILIVFSPMIIRWINGEAMSVG